MANEKTTVSLRLDNQLKRALDRAARDDARSLSSLITKIVSDWLKQNQPKRAA